ncbi:unnamed protein product, partial [Closterium sp. NIES-53]
MVSTLTDCDYRVTPRPALRTPCPALPFVALARAHPALPCVALPRARPAIPCVALPRARPALPRVALPRARPALPRVALPHARPAPRPSAASASRPAAASASRPAAAHASRSAAPRVVLCCSPHVAPCCPARRALRLPRVSHSAALRVVLCCSPCVAPCCPARRALRQPARRALLQPTRRALLPHASRPAAPRVAPCCPARHALLQPVCRALLPCTACALLPTPARLSRAAQPEPPCPTRSALLLVLLLLLLLVLLPSLLVTAVVAAVGVVATVVAVTVALFGAEFLAVARCSYSGVRPLCPGSFSLAMRMSSPHWLELLRSGVDVFALDYDAILTAMYALPSGAESDCYLCVEHDPGIEVAALGASEAAALGARESALLGTAPAEALHTFTLDSGASCCFFRDSTALTPLPAPVAVSLADPSGGPVLAQSTTVLLCPVVPSGSLSGLHLPSFSTNLRAAPHSSSFPPTEAPLQILHMDVWGPARVRGQGGERYFLLVVDDYSRYTTVFPLHTKGEVPAVLILWIRAVRLQLRERFRQDLRVLCLHFDRGGEFSSDLLRAFCQGEGILQSLTLLGSPQQNGVAERRIGLVMEIALLPPHLVWCLSSQDVTFDKSVPFYCLFPYRTAPLPPPPLFLAPGPPSVDPLPPQGPAPSGVSQVDPLPLAEPVEVTSNSGAAAGGAARGATSEGAESVLRCLGVRSLAVLSLRVRSLGVLSRRVLGLG